MKLTETLSFLSAFVKNPGSVSSIIPTSDVSMRRICAHVPRDVRQVIVEYGPGVGKLADHLTLPRRMTHDSVLILIEKVEELAAHVQQKFQHDKRVRVHHDSAENVREILATHGELEAHNIFTSIPFSLMPEEVVRHILAETKAVLSPDGALTVFLFRKITGDMVRRVFENISTERAWWNIPPLYVFRALKNGTHNGGTNEKMTTE